MMSDIDDTGELLQNPIEADERRRPRIAMTVATLLLMSAPPDLPFLSNMLLKVIDTDLHV